MNHQDLLVSAYLQRIGWPSGMPTPATRATLDQLVSRHVAHIPFENLDPLHRHPVDIASHAVHDKLIGQRRGGYCYEHNRLLSDVLQRLGFQVTELGARVLWRQPEGSITPRTHMLLKVEDPDGALLVDAGFGGLTVTTSLRLGSEAPQETPLETFRLRREGDDRVLEARLGDAWHALYCFDLSPHQPCDYIAPSYFLSTHPESVFVNNLMVARAGFDCRWTLFNLNFSTYPVDGAAKHRTLSGPQELADVLEQVFLLPASMRERILLWTFLLFED